MLESESAEEEHHEVYVVPLTCYNAYFVTWGQLNERGDFEENDSQEAVDKDPEDVIDDPIGSRSDPVPSGGWYHFHDDVQIHLLLVKPPNNNTREENMKYQREEKRPHRGVDHDRVTKTSLHKCCLQFCRSFRLVICL